MEKLCGASLFALVSLTFVHPAAAQGTVEFVVDGQKVTSTVHNFARFSAKSDYNLTSSMHKDKRVVQLNVREPATGKTLALGSFREGNYGSYQPEYGKRSNSARITSGTITFTTFDLSRRTFSATFAFTAKDGAGKIYEVRQGAVKDGVIGKDAVLH
jgi:hypothetical protein